jgi:hypothetical protein
MEPISVKTIGKYKVEVMIDEDPSDPRGDDNLGTMVCFHNGYNLGDKHEYDHECFRGWDEMKEDMIRKENAGVILPLYLYDHSGITMNTTGFHCPWDSGQVGFIFISKEKMRYEYSKKRISKQLIERVRGYLVSEVEHYNNYLMGSAYGFCITNTETDEEVDSCWGFIGDANYCEEEGVRVAEYMVDADKQGQLELEL